MQHSDLLPVIHVFWFNGQPVNVRRACGGTLDEAAAAFVETMLLAVSIDNAALTRLAYARGCEVLNWGWVWQA